MSFIDVIKTIFEVILVLGTLWAVFNEDRFIKLERRIKAAFRRRKIKTIKVETVVCRSTF